MGVGTPAAFRCTPSALRGWVGDGLPRIGGALGSVSFQYVGVWGVQFCQYIVSMLEYSRGSFGGYGDNGEGRGLGGEVEVGRRGDGGVEEAGMDFLGRGYCADGIYI